MNRKIGIFPAGHRWTEKLKSLWSKQVPSIELTEDLTDQEIDFIYIHSDSAELPDVSFLLPHTIEQLTRYDFVSRKSNRVKSLLADSFGEFLQLERIQPQSQFSAIVTYDSSARFYIHLLAKMGFKDFLILQEEQEPTRDFCAGLRRDILGANFETCLYQSLTVNPLIGSVLVAARTFQEEDESYKILCYLNFLSRGAFVMSRQDQPKDILKSTAAESNLHYLSPGRLSGFQQYRFLSEIRSLPEQFNRVQFIQHWEDFEKT